ncbi:hypothetical protein TNCV_2789751 [Trichonephila clavipes]|nr:hypothetical protein TNCV_2789751 [Trichonephila clavipes]
MRNGVANLASYLERWQLLCRQDQGLPAARFVRENSLLSPICPEKSLGVSKRHRMARWMQRQSLFGQLVGLFVFMNTAMRWDPLENDLSSGAKK